MKKPKSLWRCAHCGCGSNKSRETICKKCCICKTCNIVIQLSFSGFPLKSSHNINCRYYRKMKYNNAAILMKNLMYNPKQLVQIDKSTSSEYWSPKH